MTYKWNVAIVNVINYISAFSAVIATTKHFEYAMVVAVFRANKVTILT